MAAARQLFKVLPLYVHVHFLAQAKVTGLQDFLQKKEVLEKRLSKAAVCADAYSAAR